MRKMSVLSSTAINPSPQLGLSPGSAHPNYIPSNTREIDLNNDFADYTEKTYKISFFGIISKIVRNIRVLRAPAGPASVFFAPGTSVSWPGAQLGNSSGRAVSITRRRPASQQLRALRAHLIRLAPGAPRS